MNTLVTVVSVMLGTAGGTIVSLVTSLLPPAMRKQWWADAHEFLSIPCSPQQDDEHVAVLDNIISVRTLLAATACSAICYFLLSTLGLTINALVYSVLSWALLSIALIDYKTLYIPDVIVIPALWAGLIFVALVEPQNLQSHVFGAAIGYGALRWLPVGQGDAKLCAAAGAWLGAQALFTYFLIGSVLGVLVSLGYYLVRGKSEACPFGPSLITAFLVTIAMQLLNFQPLKLW